MRWFSMLTVFMVLGGCANSCSCSGSGSAEGTSSFSTTAEPAPGQEKSPLPPAAAVIDGPVVAWEAFKPFAPDAFEGYQADEPPSGKKFGLPNDSQIATLRRTYKKGDASLEIELIDTAQAPGVRELFLQASQMSRQTAQSVMRPSTVRGHKALEQWNEANATARASVLVADRLLVNVNVKPASSPDVARALAEKVDLEGVAALVTKLAATK